MACQNFGNHFNTCQRRLLSISGQKYAEIGSELSLANVLGPYSRKVPRTYAYRNSLLNPWLVFQKCSNSSSGAKTGATLRILKHGVRWF